MTYYLAISSAITLALLSTIVQAEENKVEPNDSFQKNRVRIAKDAERRAGELTATTISLRQAKTRSSEDSKKTSGGILNTYFGFLNKTTSLDEKPTVEVLATLKSGDEIVIDRIDGRTLGEVPQIVDSKGDLVGFFKTWNSKNSLYASAHGAFVMYFAGERSLIERTGEMKCDKVESDGKSNIRFSNAQWSNDAQELTFEARSSCGVISAYGGNEPKNLLNLTLHSDFNIALGSNSKPYTDEGKRLTVAFDQSTQFKAIEIYDPNVKTKRKEDLDRKQKQQKEKEDKKQAFEKCMNTARSLDGFHVCGPNELGSTSVVWHTNGTVKEAVSDCGAADTSTARDVSKSQFIEACNFQHDKRTTLFFTAVEQSMNHELSFQLGCTPCSSLIARRIAFDANKHEITFNIDTDASSIEFEDAKFDLPSVTSKEHEGKSIMIVPVFTVKFNDKWQVVEMSAAGQTATSARQEPEQRKEKDD